MKKILFLVLVILNQLSSAQKKAFYLSGSVKVESGADVMFMGFGNPDPDLLLVMFKNGVEISRSGPNKNSTSGYFTWNRIWLENTDTLVVRCYDVDYNNPLLTMGLNSDDDVCSFIVPVSELFTQSRYSYKIPDSQNEISIYVKPYIGYSLAVTKFVPYDDVTRRTLKPFKQGLGWHIEDQDSTQSSFQKPIKRIVTWNDRFIINCYEGEKIRVFINTADLKPKTAFNIEATTGTLKGVTHYGEFTVEMKPE